MCFQGELFNGTSTTSTQVLILYFSAFSLKPQTVHHLKPPSSWITSTRHSARQASLSIFMSELYAQGTAYILLGFDM